MYNITNYSIFFATELKSRFVYVVYCVAVLSLIGIYNYNLFMIHLLYPLELSNLETTREASTSYISNNININNVYIYDNIELAERSNIFEYYPVFEINIMQNNILYYKILSFMILLFMLPLVMYQLFLFILPSLMPSEYVSFRNSLILYIFLYNLYNIEICNQIMSLFVNLTYNQYQEFYNYEFDIEFDFNMYVTNYILYYLIFNLHVALMIILYNITHYSINNVMWYKIILFFTLISCIYNLILLIFLIVSYYIFLYMCHIKYNIMNLINL